MDGGTAIACIPLNTPNANDINIYLKIKLRCAKFSSFKYIHKIGINNDYMYIVDEYSLSMFCSTRTTTYHTLLHTRAYTRRRAYMDDVRQSTHSTVSDIHTHTHTNIKRSKNANETYYAHYFLGDGNSDESRHVQHSSFTQYEMDESVYTFIG